MLKVVIYDGTGLLYYRCGRCGKVDICEMDWDGYPISVGYDRCDLCDAKMEDPIALLNCESFRYHWHNGVEQCLCRGERGYPLC